MYSDFPRSHRFFNHAKSNKIYFEDDVNDVKWSPNGDAIASASDDSTIRLFDLRADAELGCYQRKPVMFACNALDFSVS